MDWNELARFGKERPDGLWELSISLPASETGKVRRCCPDRECTPGLFLLGDAPDGPPARTASMRRAPQTDGVTCPYCGTDTGDEDWICTEDENYAIEQITQAVVQDARDHLDQTARAFSRKSSGLLGISMRIEGRSGFHSRVIIEDLLRELSCHQCGREYGVFAIGLFCPDCSVANLTVHFAREVELVCHQLDLADAAEDQEVAWRLLGNAHEDVVTALETYLKVTYRFVVKRRYDNEKAAHVLESLRGNTFQNPDRAVDRYADLGVNLFGGLDEDERRLVNIYVNMRHVIGHNLGIVDEKFTQATEQGSPGETVVLKADDVRKFADVGQHVIFDLEAALPELSDPEG